MKVDEAVYRVAIKAAYDISLSPVLRLGPNQEIGHMHRTYHTS
jgi:hypothetical protein